MTYQGTSVPWTYEVRFSCQKQCHYRQLTLVLLFTVRSHQYWPDLQVFGGSFLQEYLVSATKIHTADAEEIFKLLRKYPIDYAHAHIKHCLCIYVKNIAYVA